MTYCPTPAAACSATRSSMNRARVTMDARKGRVNGLMSGRLRHSPSGAASLNPTVSSNTCGGASASTSKARHKATRTAVSSGLIPDQRAIDALENLAGVLRVDTAKRQVHVDSHLTRTVFERWPSNLTQTS